MSIFLSYRRQQAQDFTQTIYDKYIQNYVEDNKQSTIFFDQEIIVQGDRFNQVLQDQLQRCTIFVPVIYKDYLKELIERQQKGEFDYLAEELKSVYRRNAQEQCVKIFPIRVSDDLRRKDIINSDLDQELKDILLDLYFIQTEIHSDPINTYQAKQIVGELFLAYSNHQDYIQNEIRIKDFITTFKEAKNLKVLIVGPSALYNRKNIRDIKDKFQSHLSKPHKELINTRIGSSLMRACEWYLQNSNDNVPRILDVLTNKENYDDALYEELSKSLDKFDIILNFSLLDLVDHKKDDQFIIFNNILEPEFKDLKLRKSTVDLINDKENQPKIVINIQNISYEIMDEDEEANRISLFTSTDYLNFLEKYYTQLDPVTILIQSKRRVFTIFSGVGEVDLILKAFINRKLGPEQALKSYDNIKSETKKIILYGQDFDIIQKRFYINKNFTLHDIAFRQFLSKLNK
jgi:hypothetical protein